MTIGGLLDAITAGGAAAGGRGLGFGLTAYAAYKLLAFLCMFVAGRLDARQRALDAQQARLDERYDARLVHLERNEQRNQSRIHVLEQALEILSGELHAITPGNPKLLEVAAMLHRAGMGADPEVPADMAATLRRMK